MGKRSSNNENRDANQRKLVLSILFLSLTGQLTIKERKEINPTGSHLLTAHIYLHLHLFTHIPEQGQLCRAGRSSTQKACQVSGN